MISNNTIVLAFGEEKKHSVRYNTTTLESPLLTSVYVSKDHLPRPFPQRIKVTVEPVTQ